MLSVDGGVKAPTYTIIGSSQQLDREPRLQELIDNTISIGINYIYQLYNTKHLVGLDLKFIKREENIIKGYKQVFNEIDVAEDEIGFYGYTVSAAVNYIYKVSPKSKVYLVGIDQSLEGNRARCSKYPYLNVKIRYSKKLELGTREFIERHNMDIYQTDLQSKDWNLKYKSIEEVLNDN